MIYNGKEIKKLGFGLMRLPMLEDEVDLEQTKEMVDIFMENGFTYFDTAYGYLGGKSELAVKPAIVERYPRESFQLATKLPAWSVKSAQEAKQMFYTSLERTGAGYFDFYLLHNLGGNRTQFFEDYDIWNFAAEQKELGKIKKLGFSLHDNAKALDEVLTKHPEVDFVQLQINYADWEDGTNQSRLCYETAQKHGKPVIIMEPIRGGALTNPPQKVADILTAYDNGNSFAQWALRFTGSLDNIITVLSGMSLTCQMKENVSFMKDFKALNNDEQNVIKKVQDVLKTIHSVPCTNCQYCVKDCPMGIAIPSLFAAMNKYYVFDDINGAKGTYNFETVKRNTTKASGCIACGRCEAVCPQSIKIIDELKLVAEKLEA
ncbi:MAG: aldo/keto reductase [Clostridia bacterium]